MASQSVLAVIQMNGLQIGKSDAAVEFFQNTVQIIHNIVSPIPHMTGIQTNSYFVFLLHKIHDGLDLLKFSTYLRTLSGHGLQKHCSRLLIRQYIIQNFCNFFNAGFHSLPYMAAGMKIIIISRRRFHTPQVICHGLSGKHTKVFLCRTCIQCIRRVRHDFSEMLFSGNLQIFFNIFWINFLCIAAPGISGKKCKSISAVFHHLTSHCRITFGRCCMISDI